MSHENGVFGTGAVALIALLAFAGCGSSNSARGDNDGGTQDATSSGSSSGGGGRDASHEASSDSGSGGDEPSGTDSGSGVDSGPALYDPSVYQHHKNGTRDGLYIDPILTQATAKTMHTLTGFMGTVSTGVYAQPLYVVDGPGGAEAYFVATAGNHLTAYNAATGVVLWDRGPTTYGNPVTAMLPCGDINPLGITGTPYIDIASRTIFFDAMTTPDNNVTAKQMVYAVSLDTGAVQQNWPVDVSARVPGFTSNIQNQRGALQFLNGILYVAYGGMDGDCDNYYGWVIGFPVTNPQSPTAWHTAALKGGIWGPGALPTDGTSIFPVTGNTAGTNGTWGGGEAVLRLAPGPTFSGNAVDYYTPANWLTLDDKDQDLGGASEVLFDMPGAPHPHLVVAAGKDENLYILDRDNLGGVGGELLKTLVATGTLKGAPAAYTTAKGTYVALHVDAGTGTGCPAGQGGNLVVMQITQSPMAATTAWCAPSALVNLGSPIVTTTDGISNAIVWNANDALYGWDGDTGAVIVDGTNTKANSLNSFNTPIEGNGRIAMGARGQLYVFTP